MKTYNKFNVLLVSLLLTASVPAFAGTTTGASDISASINAWCDITAPTTVSLDGGSGFSFNSVPAAVNAGDLSAYCTKDTAFYVYTNSENGEGAQSRVTDGDGNYISYGIGLDNQVTPTTTYTIDSQNGVNIGQGGLVPVNNAIWLIAGDISQAPIGHYSDTFTFSVYFN